VTTTSIVPIAESRHLLSAKRVKGADAEGLQGRLDGIARPEKNQVNEDLATTSFQSSHDRRRQAPAQAPPLITSEGSG